MNTSDTHTAEDNQAKLTQNENLGGNLPEQAEPSVCDIQNHAEIEKLLGTDELAYGYVYQNGQRTEYMFQGTPENIGYFIDKCPDQELLDEIKKTLIPSNEYDHIIEMLDAMGFGDALAQDCRVVEISSTYPILNRLVAQNVNVDELDCKQSSKKGQMGVRTKTWTKLRWRYPHV